MPGVVPQGCVREESVKGCSKHISVSHCTTLVLKISGESVKCSIVPPGMEKGEDKRVVLQEQEKSSSRCSCPCLCPSCASSTLLLPRRACQSWSWPGRDQRLEVSGQGQSIHSSPLPQRSMVVTDLEVYHQSLVQHRLCSAAG